MMTIIRGGVKKHGYFTVRLTATEEGGGGGGG